jgi:hypothetical protein
MCGLRCWELLGGHWGDCVQLLRGGLVLVWAIGGLHGLRGGCILGIGRRLYCLLGWCVRIGDRGCKLHRVRRRSVCRINRVVLVIGLH